MITHPIASALGAHLATLHHATVVTPDDARRIAARDSGGSHK